MITKVSKRLRHKKLWTLVRDAVKDLKKVHEDEKYTFNMNDWHVPNGKCAVCVAGAVIAKSLGSHHKKRLEPWDFDHKTKVRLTALNDIRKGRFHSAADGLDIELCQRDRISLDRAYSYYMDEPLGSDEDFIEAWKEFAVKAKEIGV